MTQKPMIVFLSMLMMLLTPLFGFDILPSQQPPKNQSRRHFCQLSTLLLVQQAPSSAVAKSYSQNARNMERLNAGDASGGSVYDNNPATDNSRKRRAMTGCKIPSAREELGGLSEKDCNVRVMQGDTEFMLEALRKLECPTCPYGVATTRSP
jgi:hypothetical protein